MGRLESKQHKAASSIRKRIELDIWYIDNWSPLLDLKILLKTFPWAMINDERMGAESETIAEADIKVIVATHKSYWMPSDELYVPVQVGAEGKEDLGYTSDNTGDNISSKNANYCELTGLYWAWKNLSCDYLGLAHYRRHFTAIRGTDDRRDVLTIDQARDLLGHVDVLLPKKRNYLIETNYKQYIHAHHAIDLDETRRIIEEFEGDPNKNVQAYATFGTEQYERMVEKLRSRLHITSLKFCSVQDLVDAIGLPKEKICTHCFDNSSYGHE